MTKDTKNLIVAIDIGTSKVAVIAAEVMPSGRHEVIGFGHQESKGLKKGVVTNIDATVESVQRAVEQAEHMAGCSFKSAHVSITGSHIRSFNSNGVVPVRGSEVTASDVDQVIETAKAVNIPTDQQLLHTIPQQYIVDSQEDVREPIGMSGIRLEVMVHIVTAAVSAVENILKCVRRCDLKVSELVLQSTAAADAVLTKEERELGVVLIDIGAGTTDVAVIIEGAIFHTAVIPVAGDQVTNDIAMALRTTTAEAEEIKLRAGVAKQSLTTLSETLVVQDQVTHESRTLLRKDLAGVIQPRVEEIFALVREELREAGCADVLAGVVVLTGGATQMPGMVDIAEDIFGRPVRIGVPEYSWKMAELVRNPRFATVLGVLEEAKAQHLRGQTAARTNGAIKTGLRRMKQWFVRYF